MNSASSSSGSARCFGISPSTTTAAADGSSAAAANAKRKLEHSTAPATHTIKMPRDTTQRRRGSSSIAASDPCAMKRSFSDGTICGASRTDERLSKATAPCLQSPTVVALSALQKNVMISPRTGVSPRISSSLLTAPPPPPPSFQHEPCVEEECDDDDDDADTQSVVATRKHGQLAPLPIATCTSTAAAAGAADRPTVRPLQSPRLTSRGKFARTRSSEPLQQLSPVPTSPHASLAIDMDLELPDTSSSSACAMPYAHTLPASVPAHQARHWPAPVTKKTRNPGNLSLDLSQMDQPTFESSSSSGASSGSTARRNDSAATCSRVTDFLYVGGAVVAKDRDTLLQTGITHIINCAASVAPDCFPLDFRYLNLRLRDHSSQDIARHFYTVFDFIETARRRGGRVFVHCVKGISRSPTMAIAYLMWYKRIGMYKALDFIRVARPVVDPNAGFIFQLTEWEHLHREGSLKLERTVVFRVEVPRETSSCGTGGNGSRAAEKPLLVGPLTAIDEDVFHNPTKESAKLSFIVACADYMVIWCGADASPTQVEASQHATALLQTYESFPDKYEIVYHGQESSSFWNLVGALRPDES